MQNFSPTLLICGGLLLILASGCQPGDSAPLDQHQVAVSNPDADTPPQPPAENPTSPPEPSKPSPPVDEPPQEPPSVFEPPQEPPPVSEPPQEPPPVSEPPQEPPPVSEPPQEPPPADDEPTQATAPVVDTGQRHRYAGNGQIDAGPAGQDADHQGHQAAYAIHDDGTVSDLVTGLMWTQSPDLDGNGRIDSADKLDYDAAMTHAQQLVFAGYDDWRLPSITELYSLMHFEGIDPSGPDPDLDQLRPFIDTSVFAFAYGDTDAGDRLIDAQFASSTTAITPIMHGEDGMYGVNFADGRIKCYPRSGKGYYLLCVRGRQDYDQHAFIDNQDGTITDAATGLMWQQDDSGAGLDWEQALDLAQTRNAEGYLGYDDWRLPNAKEMQHLVDYSRSPRGTGTAAIDPLFTCTPITDEVGASDMPYYWTSTTHINLHGGDRAVYIAFGSGLGWMRDRSGSYQLLDVHGAGCQRSDPKIGDASTWPYGHGPQGDVIRIRNHVRLVRDSTIPMEAPTAVAVRSDLLQRPTSTASRCSRNRRPPPPEIGFIQRLDRNGDLLVSRREFDGPPHDFDRHDRNHDGQLSADEAPPPPPHWRRPPPHSSNCTSSPPSGCAGRVPTTTMAIPLLSLMLTMAPLASRLMA